MAALLAERIADGETVGLDASSSALFAARALLSRKRLTLITNSVEILGELAGKTDWNILCTGGMLKGSGLALVGRQAERMIGGFRLGWAILSCKGLDAEMGFMDSNEADSEIKRAFLESATQAAFAVDQSKFDQRAFVQVAPLEAAALVVTDAPPTPAWRQRFAQAGVELLYDPTEPPSIEEA
jgi:DeoR/GlpR family transcriptional regulator of sugar metabolism